VFLYKINVTVATHTALSNSQHFPWQHEIFSFMLSLPTMPLLMMSLPAMSLGGTVGGAWVHPTDDENSMAMSRLDLGPWLSLGESFLSSFARMGLSISSL